MKSPFYKSVFGITGPVIVLSICALAYSNTVNANETPLDRVIASGGNEAPKERLEGLLLKMGYIDVDVNACVMQFRRNLPNQCPTDKPLSYWRSIDLRNLDMEAITEVQSRETDGYKWYVFTVSPTRDYYWRSIGILGFKRLIKEKYSDAGWPFRFDETAPLIRKEFYRKFPKNENMNWWISESCFGESPDFEVDYIMSYDDQSILLDFRSSLIDYDKSNYCKLERLNN